MTAEVAVLNTSGIALAADSAVTIGTQKIYNSAIKLFAISKIAPVAVMIYGNANLIDVPWELIVKLYRQRIAAKTFTHLEDYAKDFFDFVESRPEFLSEESGESWLANRTIAYWMQCREEVESELSDEIREQPEGIDSDAIEEKFIEEIRRSRDSLSAKDDLPEAISASQKAKEKIESFAEHFGREIFGESLLGKIREDLIEIGVLLFKKDVFPANSTGVVLAGYGDEEIFPGVITHEVEGGISGYLRRRRDQEKSEFITVRSPATIIPFAQDDMVATFMEGINPGFVKFFNSRLNELFEAIPAQLANAIGGSKKAIQQRETKLAAICDKLLKQLMDMMMEHRYEEHIHPVLQMVEVLPKNELAEMAETLVNLTAFKRRVTHSVESVGGPVDVCVISKGDGLVWVRRKHYFPAELNHLFYTNYARGLA